jgi:ligand-binding sensor domain-containing protein
LPLAVCLAEATGYHAESWGADQGLPNNTVTTLAQTPDDYWWAGTPNGLARFDGVRFTVFSPQNTPALGSGRVQSLLTDVSGALWIATADGVLVRMKDASFTAGHPPDTRGERGAAQTMAAEADGTLWLVTERGVRFAWMPRSRSGWRRRAVGFFVREA